LQKLFLINDIKFKKNASINVKKHSLYTHVIDSHIENSIGTVDLVAEHVGVVTMCSTSTTTNFIVPIFAVFDV